MTIVIGDSQAYDVSAKLDTHRVPLVLADENSIAPYGNLVFDYDAEKVIIKTWPAPGWRKVDAGTGNEGGITEGRFVMKRHGNELQAINHAVNGHYITGWFNDPTQTENHKLDYPAIFTREANYHPDGGQVFFPIDKAPFVLLLALPGDDITPNDFVGFYCSGEFGVQIKPDIWHQPPFPIHDNAAFDDKQGKVHACISCDFVKEFGVYLQVPLDRGAVLQKRNIG